ncbi:MAG: hypothetical protein AB4042_16100 [Leptolyngbyaceae cyanobacterium]
MLSPQFQADRYLSQGIKIEFLGSDRLIYLCGKLLLAIATPSTEEIGTHSGFSFTLQKPPGFFWFTNSESFSSRI